MSFKEVAANVVDSWQFTTAVEFDDGHRESYYVGKGSYQDEYGSTQGSFREDVQNMCKKFDNKRQPVANVLILWLERTISYQYHDQYETYHEIIQKLYKQEQRNSSWWCYFTHDTVRDMLSDEKAITDNVVYPYEKWQYSSRRYR